MQSFYTSYSVSRGYFLKLPYKSYSVLWVSALWGPLRLEVLKRKSSKCLFSLPLVLSSFPGSKLVGRVPDSYKKNSEILLTKYWQAASTKLSWILKQKYKTHKRNLDLINDLCGERLVNTKCLIRLFPNPSGKCFNFPPRYSRNINTQLSSVLAS